MSNETESTQDKDKDKSALLSQLRDLGVDTSSGRKVRSDKGKSRGPNSKVRSDLGTRRTRYVNLQPKMKIYFSVKNRLLHRVVTDEDEALQLDHNNIFIVIKRKNKSVKGYNQVVYRGKALHRTVKHIQVKSIDLEKLRFEAIQDVLFDDFTCQDAVRFKQELRVLNLPNNCSFFDLFAELYHVEPEDVPRWKYEDWRVMYDIVSSQLLPPEFKFRYDERPGTEEFNRKYGEAFELKRLSDLAELANSKEYINEKARYRDLLLAQEKQKYRFELLNDPASEDWTINKLTREVNKRIDKEKIDKQVEDYMLEWSNNKLNNKE